MFLDTNFLIHLIIFQFLRHFVIFEINHAKDGIKICVELLWFCNFNISHFLSISNRQILDQNWSTIWGIKIYPCFCILELHIVVSYSYQPWTQVINLNLLYLYFVSRLYLLHLKLLCLPLYLQFWRLELRYCICMDRKFY